MKHLGIILLAVSVITCLPEDELRRDTRPSDDSVTPPGYLDSTEVDVAKTEGATITISQTKVILPENMLNQDYSVRLKTLAAEPDIGKTDVGTTAGDIVEIEIVEQSAKASIDSARILASYRISQTFPAPTEDMRIGVHIVADPGSDSEQTFFVDQSQLDLESNTALSLLTESAGFETRVTHAVFWFVYYDEDSAFAKTVTISDLGAISSNGADSTTIETTPGGQGGDSKMQAIAGDLDLSFGNNGVLTGADSRLTRAVFRTTDSSIWTLELPSAEGTFFTLVNRGRDGVIKDINGEDSNTFERSPDQTADNVSLEASIKLADGRVMVAGIKTNADTPASYAAILNADGGLDASLLDQGFYAGSCPVSLTSNISSLLQDKSGRILMVTTEDTDPNFSICVERWSLASGLDTSFGGGGKKKIVFADIPHLVKARMIDGQVDVFFSSEGLGSGPYSIGYFRLDEGRERLPGGNNEGPGGDGGVSVGPAPPIDIFPIDQQRFGALTKNADTVRAFVFDTSTNALDASRGFVDSSASNSGVTPICIVPMADGRYVYVSESIAGASLWFLDEKLKQEGVSAYSTTLPEELNGLKRCLTTETNLYITYEDYVFERRLLRFK